jgi:ABC-type uncharacterized transport system permease subunit
MLLSTHQSLAFLAYMLFGLAALQSGVMAAMEKRLHQHRAEGRLSRMPPLLTMEQWLFRFIGIGFVLLTLALATGIVFSEQMFGKPFSFHHFTQHKTVFAFISWFIYGGLLLGRRVYGWRGRTAIGWSLAGFAMLVLAYFGTKLVLELVRH